MLRTPYLSGVFLVLAAVLFPAATLKAQVSGGQGRFTIGGRVLYEHNNQPASQVPISLRNFTDMGMDQMATDLGGSFSFSVGRGVYYVSIRQPGYGEVSERVEVGNFSQTSLLLYLRAMPAREASATPKLAVSAEYLQVPQKARESYEAGLREFTRTGNLDASLKLLQKSIELHPDFAAAHYWKGMVLLDRDDFDGARASFEEAIRLSEKLAAAYFPLGSLYLHFREAGKAAEVLEKGLEQLPSYWQGHYELARAWVSLGKLKQAEASALRARELKPDFARIHVLLANVYWGQGRDAEALAEAEKFLVVAPEDPVAAEIRRRVEELKKAAAVKPPGSE